MNFKWNTHVLDASACKRGGLVSKQTCLDIRFSGLFQRVTKSFSTLVGLSLMLGFACLTGCSDEAFQDSQGNEGPGIGFTTSVVERGLVSRGTPITAAASLTNMGVFCYPTGFNSWATAGTSATPTLMNNLLFTQSGGKWSSSPAVGWGADVSVAQKFTFFGYTPQATAANGLSVLSTTGTPKLRYTVPTTIGDQPDLMIAASKDIHPTSGQVPLAYKHALTCLAFNVSGSSNDIITDIKVKGVSVTGDLTWAADGTPEWSHLDAPTSTTYSVGLKDGLVNVTPDYQDALAADGYLMMIPQTLESGAQLVVSIQGKEDKVFDLASQTTTTWTAGQRLTYNISLQSSVITVSPAILFVGTPGTDSRYSKVEVACDPLDAAWTLHANSASLTLSLNSDGTGASGSVSGVGPKTVYVLMGANLTATKKDVRLSIDDKDPNSEPACVVRQASYSVSGLDAYKYVGAFWKKGETQERIIRIPSPSYDMNNGPWIASVVWADENWNAGDIVLENSLPFPGNPYSEGLNTGPGDSWISATTTESVSGNVTYRSDGAFSAYTANNFIYFRIGLKSTFTPTADAPARYAIVALGYRNGFTLQQILIRQGEDPDYVMGSGPGYCKFSPYNLRTFSNFMTNSYLDVVQNGAWWTYFPTQSGSFFQYANVDYPRRAYSPTTLSATGWSSKSTGVFTATEEVCPAGYRRFTAVRDAASDIYTNLNKDYYAAGYYADGFFDRLKIGDGVNQAGAVQAKYSTATVVNAGGAGTETFLGHAGAVCYNPETAASVFFPFSGIRNSGTTTAYAGKYGYYWASNIWSGSSAVSLFSDLPYQINGFVKYYACPIRCVKD